MQKSILISTLLISTAFSASFKSSTRTRNSALCDLSTFTCNCGDIDVIKCRCNEWSRKCPKEMVYSEQECSCVAEVTGRSMNEDNPDPDNQAEQPENSTTTTQAPKVPNPDEFPLISPIHRKKLNAILASTSESSSSESSSPTTLPYDPTDSNQDPTDFSDSNQDPTDPSDSNQGPDTCYIPECRPCDELNVTTCTCYQVSIDCLRGYIPTSDGCDCVRDNSTSISDKCPGLGCNDGLSVNEAYCNCTAKICDAEITCVEPKLLDMDTCTCVCSLADWNCPKNFIIDKEACVCREPPCEPKFSCDENYKWDYDLCSCACVDRPNCTSDLYVVDPLTCTCTCPSINCEPGYMVDKLTCLCVPDHEPQCPPRFTYDHELCRCICQTFNECPFGFVFDEDQCKCVCPKAKPCDESIGLFWSDQHCSCVCRSTNETCEGGFVFDNTTCKCICDPKHSDDECGEGEMFDRKVCGCVKGVRPTCPKGFVYDENECDCVCENEGMECKGSGIFDKDTCQCVCLIGNVTECDEGYFSEEECGCVLGLPKEE